MGNKSYSIVGRCEQCGTPSGGNFRPGQRFCSKACQRAAYNDARRSTNIDKYRRVCGICGGPIPEAFIAAAKYCGEECKRVAKLESAKRNRVFKAGAFLLDPLEAMTPEARKRLQLHQECNKIIDKFITASYKRHAYHVIPTLLDRNSNPAHRKVL